MWITFALWIAEKMTSPFKNQLEKPKSVDKGACQDFMAGIQSSLPQKISLIFDFKSVVIEWQGTKRARDLFLRT